MSSEKAENFIVKEYRPLTHILKKIPRKAQSGLWKNVDIVIKCVDATADFIALGCNIGTVFLYDRKLQDITRLKGDTFLDEVTAVKIHVGLNVQIAFGLESGRVSIFQLPSKLVGHSKELQKFQITDLHACKVTCLQWSTNGQKLFSGDTSGVIVCSETDFLENSCKSQEIHHENIEVVQMDYSFHMLLISTLLRAVICFTDQEYRTIQIGQKDRRCLGPYGVCFGSGAMNANEVVIYSSRPGLRIWEANRGGVVESTYIFKENIHKPMMIIPLLKDEPASSSAESFQFSRLSMFNEDYLLSWSSGDICLLSLSQNAVISTQYNLGTILHVSVSNNEIFVLRQNCEPAVIRISTDVESHIADMEHYSISHTSLAPKFGPTESLARNITMSSVIHADDLKKTESPLKFVKKNIKKLINSQPTSTSATSRPKSSPESSNSLKVGDTEVYSNKNVKDDITTEKPCPFYDYSIEIPPIVKLTSDQMLPSLKLNNEVEAEVQPTAEVKVHESPDVNVVQDVRTSKENFYRLNKISQPEKTEQVDSSIVFTSKPKKLKKKKVKDKTKNPSDQTLVSEERENEFTGFLQEINADSEKELSGSLPEMIESRDKFYSVLVDSSKLPIPNSPTSSHGSLTKSTEYHRDNFPSSQSNTYDFLKKDEDLQNLEINASPTEDNLSTNRMPNDFKVTEVFDNNEKLINYDSNIKVNDIRKHTYSDLELSVEKMSEIDEIDHSVSINFAKNSIDSERSVEISHSVECRQVNSSESDVFLEADVSEQKHVINVYDITDESEHSLDDIYINRSQSHSSIGSLSPPADMSVMRPSESITEEPRARCDLRVMDNNNVWAEFSSSFSIQSLSVSLYHIWLTDKNENLYISLLPGLSLKWRKLDIPAKQVSVSPSGNIVWILYQGNVYAACNVSTKLPAGTKWVRVSSDVSYISVANGVGWFIKNNGDVQMQKSLTRERPTNKTIGVPCKYKLTSIACNNGVTWALTDKYRLISRVGITTSLPEGSGWLLEDQEHLYFSGISLGYDNIGWGVGVLGNISFCCEVSAGFPLGNKKWWQIQSSSYIINEQSTLEKAWAGIKDIPAMLNFKAQPNWMLSGNRTSLWLTAVGRSSLQACYGPIYGHLWNVFDIPGIASSAIWDLISATTGQIWLQQPNGDLFTFYADHPRLMAVQPPNVRAKFTHISSCERSVWCLSKQGFIYIRSGISARNTHGTNWIPLDITQLGDVHVVHLSCGKQMVWMIDSEGQVYHRIGTEASKNQVVNPAWVPVDNGGNHFVQIFVASNDWMVWAIDNKKQIFTRIDVTETMPLGTEWILVTGIHANTLSLSSTHVWAVTPDNMIFCRNGIIQCNPAGDCWVKVPGSLLKISASLNNDLWGINNYGNLLRRSTCTVQKSPNRTDSLDKARLSSITNADEWELINY